jgi:hypothetical protein
MKRTLKRGCPGFLAAGLLAQALLGCCTSPPPEHHEPAVLLPPTQRGRVEVAVAPDTESPGAPVEPGRPPYRALAADECQC